MIHALVVFCLVQNPYLCRTLEITHSDFQPVTSVTDCMMGGVIFSAEFTLDHMQWRTRGVRCIEDHGDIVSEQIAERVKAHLR